MTTVARAIPASRCLKGTFRASIHQIPRQTRTNKGMKKLPIMFCINVCAKSREYARPARWRIASTTAGHNLS